MRNVPRTMATQAQDALRSVAGLLQRGVDVAENHGVYGGNVRSRWWCYRCSFACFALTPLTQLRCIVAKPSAAEAEALRSEFFGAPLPRLPRSCGADREHDAGPGFQANSRTQIPLWQ